MKPEDKAWHDLQKHASAQLSAGFAARVLQAAQGPSPEAWRQLRAHAAAHIRAGFAERVLRAARNIPGVPSLLDQFAFSAVTLVACLLAVVFLHTRDIREQDDRNLAGWHQLLVEAAELEQDR